MSTECFELVIRGSLSPTLVGALTGFDVIHVDNRQTHLVGWVTDQCRLHGLLATLQDFNIQLVSLNQAVGSLGRTRFVGSIRG
jgi:hypothetical protein